jgi:two-component system sensor histidine kinase UhpB
MPGIFPDWPYTQGERMNTLAHNREPGTASRRDLWLVGGGAVTFWAVSALLELHERVSAWTRPWERYQLDELPGVLVFLALALVWYSWRRVGESRAQLLRRIDAERRLAETLMENRRLSLSHIQVQEEERKQLARELHDELGQHLNAIKIDAVSIRNWSDGRLNDVHGAACAIVEVTDHVQGIVRDMLHRLRPVGLDELGLSAALEHLVQNWRARNPDTGAALAVHAGADHLREQENITLYRIVQESLNNVAKHAKAAHVNITLDRDARGICLLITDDGAGAKQWNAASGLGLVGMRERVESLRGTLEITTGSGQGFSIEAVIPATGPVT